MAEIGIFPYKKSDFRHKKIFMPYFFLIKKIPKIAKKTCVRHVRFLRFWEISKKFMVFAVENRRKIGFLRLDNEIYAAELRETQCTHFQLI